ncbi:MAG: PEP-CTERM sorting domain-containing protein [Planctomycetota bacterium]
MMLRSIIKFLFVVLASSSTLWAATTGVPETFGDGGAPVQNGWSVGNSGSVVADAGEDGVGDNALEYGTTSGFHLLHPAFGAGAPNPVFLGDYLAAGVTGIRFKARHTGIGVPVSLRATGFSDFNLGVDWAMSAAPLVLSPNDTSWQTYELSLLPGDLLTGGPNGLSASDVLSDVFQIGLRHDPTGSGPQNPSPVATLTQVYFDDIVLVPEPSTTPLLVIAGLFCLSWRRRLHR